MRARGKRPVFNAKSNSTREICTHNEMKQAAGACSLPVIAGCRYVVSIATERDSAHVGVVGATGVDRRQRRTAVSEKKQRDRVNKRLNSDDISPYKTHIIHARTLTEPQAVISTADVPSWQVFPNLTRYMLIPLPRWHTRSPHIQIFT